MTLHPSEKIDILDMLLEDHPCVCCNGGSYGVNKQSGLPYCKECNIIFADILYRWALMDKEDREKNRDDCIYLNEIGKCWAIKGPCTPDYPRCTYKEGEHETRP